jgi:hypothetical protein
MDIELHDISPFSAGSEGFRQMGRSRRPLPRRMIVSSRELNSVYIELTIP